MMIEFLDFSPTLVHALHETDQSPCYQGDLGSEYLLFRQLLNP